MASGEALDLSGFYVVFTPNIGASEILTLQHSSFTTIERHVLPKAQCTLRPELVGTDRGKAGLQWPEHDLQIEMARFHIERELSFLRDEGFHLVASQQLTTFIMQRGFHRRLPLRDEIEKHLGR